MNSNAQQKLGRIRQEALSALQDRHLHSFGRKTASKDAVASLAAAKARLEEWLAGHGETPDALRLLALILESMTDYAAAADAIQRLIAIGGGTGGDLKRLAALSWRNTPSSEVDPVRI